MGAFLFLAKDDFRADLALGEEQLADRGADVGVVVDLLGDDVASPLQRGPDIGDPQLVGDSGAWERDMLGGLDLRVGGGILSEDDLGQRLQSLLAGDHRPGATFGAEGKVNVFQGGHRLGRVDPGLELIRQKVALLERLQNGAATLVQFLQLGQAVANGCDGDLIQQAGGLFAIAGNEGNGSAIRQQSGGGLNLRRPNR